MLQDSVFNVVFEPDRVKSICSQLLNIIPGAKLKAASVVDVLSDNMWFNKVTYDVIIWLPWALVFNMDIFTPD